MTKKTKLLFGMCLAAIIVIGGLLLLLGGPETTQRQSSDSASENSGDGDGHGEENAIELSATERQKMGVTTAAVGLRVMADEAAVPGEVTLDLYSSAQIAPRISAQIVTRRAKLGDHVKAGQALVTLSSVEMADAQGNLIIATQEWNRVRDLGREVVAERRYIEAQVAAENAHARLLAFGMTQKQIEALAKNSGTSNATGRFDLLAPRDGTVVMDDFVVGEVVEPGRLLFEITDESRVWVKAQLNSDQAGYAKVDQTVRIKSDNGPAINGRIVQTYHRLDEKTRTLPVRIEVENTDDTLHPGQYVKVAIPVGDDRKTLAIPEASITLMDGAPTVFKVEGDELHPTAIKTGVTRGGWVEVTGGLDAGDEIATAEVFLLKSLIQKSQMGEGHGH